MIPDLHIWQTSAPTSQIKYTFLPVFLQIEFTLALRQDVL